MTTDIGLSKDVPKATTHFSDAVKASAGEEHAADEAHNVPSGTLKDGHVSAYRSPPIRFPGARPNSPSALLTHPRFGTDRGHSRLLQGRMDSLHQQNLGCCFKRHH